MLLRFALTLLLVAGCHRTNAQARCNFFTDNYFGYGCELHDAVVEEENFNLVINTDNHLGTNTDANVAYFRIGNNTALRFFPSSILAQFPNIRFLYLLHAGIENLTPGSFNGCNNLFVLHARYNSFSAIPAGLFNDCASLAYLDLSDNGIEEVHEDAFANVPTLREIEIDRNQITRIPSGLFRNQDRVEVLGLESNRISEIEDNAFANLSGLRYFYLRNNSIEEINSEMFGDAIHVVFLSLDENRLTRVPRLPASAPNIFNLRFAHNQISEIADDDFTGAYQNVTIMDLSHNQLTSLNGQAFRSLQRLDNLNVGNNRIRSVDHEFFSQVPSLYTFYFDNNFCADARFYNVGSNEQIPDVERAFDRCFYHTFEPEIVYFCNFAEDATFGYTCEVSEITFLTFRHKFLFSGAHIDGHDHSHVTGLRIINSNFARVPPTIFSAFPNLQFFSLTDSQFSVVEENTFEDCGLARFIDLSRNRIQRLSRQSFRHCNHLTELILDDNRIAEIEPCNGFIMNIYQAHLLSMRRNICVDQSFETSGRLLDDYERIVNRHLSSCYSLWYEFLDTPRGALFKAHSFASSLKC